MQSSSSTRHQLLPLDALPLHLAQQPLASSSPRLLPPLKEETYKKRAAKRQGADGNGQDKSAVDSQIVRLQHALQLAGRRHIPHVGGAGRDDGSGTDAGGVFWDFLNEGVGEDVLSDGDGKGAADGVEEDGDGVCGGC